MPERLALSRTLWLVVAPSVAGFVWHLTRVLRPAGNDGADPWPRRIGIGSVVLASGATLGQFLRFMREPSGTEALVQHGVSAAAAGPIDLGLGLLFDPLSATACALACGIAVAVAAFLSSRPAPERDARTWAWLELTLAGGLLSFLASGFVTRLLGWTLAAAAAAWLAGWADPRPGALRATRGALAILALLFGAMPRAGLGSFDTSTFSIVALLVAAAAMSASAPPPGAPLALAALECGGTTGLLGPLLLVRVAVVAPLPPGAGPVIAVAGAAMVIAVARRALRTPAGASRWLALVGGSPAGLTCISLGADGATGALLVLVTAGAVASLLLLAGARRGIVLSGSRAPARADLEGALLGRAPESAGLLLLSFERWVLDAIGGAVGVCAHASAWALSRIDARRP